MLRFFLRHPHSVGETYFRHLTYAFTCGLLLVKISFIAFTHGLFPFLFETKTGDLLIPLTKELLRRRKKIAKNIQCQL